jgi:hypothetical protein
VSILAVALLALPQLASAQLPLETKSLRIQATSGTNAVTLTATGTSGYNMNFPDTLGGVGTFLFTKASGQLAWTATTPSADRTTISWNNTTGNIEWVDPNSANNPNWSRTGNAVGGILGTTAAGQSISFVTAAAANIRMTIEDDGDVLINSAATGGATTTIGRAAGHTTAIDGITNITGATTVVGATNINATGTAATNINTGAIGTTTIGFAGGSITTIGSLSHTGTSSFTGAVTLAGATSPLVANTGAGAVGNVLVSAGPTATPAWQNLSDAIGIRRAGRVALAGVNKTATAIPVPNLAATDAIIVTIDQSGDGTSSIVATVTNRTDGPTGNFHVTLSGTYTGNVNYMVIKEKTTD